MLAIGGWNEGSSRFSPMVADPARRREFVKNTVKFLRQNHFDGLDLDWEYPAFRDGGKPRDKDNYANLVQVDVSIISYRRGKDMKFLAEVLADKKRTLKIRR